MVTYVIVSATPLKKFCAPFNDFLEKLMDDLHTDSNYSTDICQVTEKICFVFNIPG